MIIRLLYGVIFGVLTIQRMDVPTVAYHLESFDAGYGAYVGFMVVDKTHTHPIALSFINLLKGLSKENNKVKNTPARANWHLAYTLLNNEELRHCRKHSIKMQRLHKRLEKTEEESVFDKLKQCCSSKNKVENITSTNA